MELCTTRGALSTPPLPISSSHCLLSNTHFRFPLQKIPHIPVSYTSRSTWLRASSDESLSNFMEKTSDAVATIGDDVTSSSLENDITVQPVNLSLNEEREYYDSKQQVASSDVEDYSSVNEALQPLKDILKNLNIELDVEDTPTILLYSGGAVVGVWLLSAIIGAIDSIPVFPKLMEVVGLGYSVWFTSRYLLIKKTREELGSKIEELKQEVLGTSDK